MKLPPPHCGDPASADRGVDVDRRPMTPDPPEIGSIRACRQNDREWSVTAKRQIDGSIDESPLQINDLFIVLFKRILEPRL
jgi:hypothetical protein